MEERQGGFISKAGWGIRYIFGEENGVEYLEYVCGHRMLYGEPHYRILENGEVEELEPESYASYPDNPDKDQAVKERNAQIREELKRKGLYLH